MSHFNVLSLGAGVQSTALYLMFQRGEMPVKLDAAIFADTQDEPAEVYAHLEWLKSLDGPPILTGTAGKLGDDLVHGTNSTGKRFVSIPAFTVSKEDGRIGKTRRQCSKEYKTEIIGQVLRRQVLGLAPKQRVPKGIQVEQYIGISLDEAGRAVRLERRVPPPKYLKRRFWLIENNWTRADCLTYLAPKVPHQTPRSACTFCPFHQDFEWNKLKQTDPEGWRRAVEIDSALRGNARAARDINGTMYLHRSAQPLELVQLDTNPPTPRMAQMGMGFATECEGVCGV